MEHGKRPQVTPAARQTEAEQTRRQLFCYFMSRLENPHEAAVQAGYPAAEANRIAAALLNEDSILQTLARCRSAMHKQNVEQQAVTGLLRLAFGSATDAARLAASNLDEGLPDIEKMDLFQLSELKRLKDGGWQFKFHDRAAALLALLKYSSEENGASKEGLYQALERSARALDGGGDGSGD